MKRRFESKATRSGGGPILEYAKPRAWYQTGEPVKWRFVVLPVVLAVGPVVLAFLFFSGGYGGMIFAAISLLLGQLCSPVAAVWGAANCIIYRRHPLAFALSFLAIIAAAGAFMYERWRMNGQWD